MPGPDPYRNPAGVPLPNDDVIAGVLGPGYDPDTALNVIKMFAGTQEMCAPVLGMVKAVFNATDIDPKYRQVIVLRSALILDVPYEWQANVPMSRNNGLTEAEIAAIGTRGPPLGLSSEFTLLCRATDELSLAARLTDDTLADLCERFGETGARKLILIISWFNLLSRFLNGCRVPMETTDKIGTRTAPIG